MASNDDLIIKIKAETKKAEQQIKDLDDQLKKLGDTSKKSTKETKAGVDGLSKSYSGLSTTLKGVAAAYLSIQTAQTLLDWTKQAADAEQAADAFDRVFEDMGLNAETEFNKIKEASKDLIPDAALKQMSVAAASLGVPINNIAGLMEVATAKAREMGISTEQAFQNMVEGIGRGSTEVLDNLGIVVKLDDAYLKWADTIGKNVKDLTAQEKKMALVNAVMEKGKKSVDRYAKAGLSASQKMQKLNSEFDNLKITIGGALLPSLEKVTEKTIEWIESLSEDDIRTFQGSVDTLVTSVSGLVETVKLLAEIQLPDWMQGDDKTQGWLGTAAEGWGKILDYVNAFVYSMAQATEDIDKQKKAFKELNDSLNNFDSSTGKFDEMSEAIRNNISAAEGLIEKLETVGSIEADKAIIELNKEIAIMKDRLKDIQSQKAFAHIGDGIKDALGAQEKLNDLTKKYTESRLKDIKKANNEEIKSNEKKVKQLLSNEEKLVQEIIKIHEQLAEKLKQIDADRFQSNLSIDQKIRDLGYQQLSEIDAFNQKQIDAQKALSLAKESLYQGELDKYKSYMSEYISLTTEAGGKAIEVEGVVLKTKQETSKIAIDALNTEKALNEQMYSQLKDLAEQEAKAKLAAKEAALDSSKAQLEATKALIKAQKELVEALTGKKVDIDLSAIDLAIQKIDVEKKKAIDLDNTRIQQKVIVDTSDIQTADTKVRELVELTLNGVTMKVDSDTKAADFGIKKMITQVEGDDITMIVNPEYEKAVKEIEKAKLGVEKNPAKMVVDADTSKGDAKIKESQKKAEKTLTSKVDYKPDTSAADRARDQISKPIIVPVTYVPTNSPPSGASPAQSGAPFAMPQGNAGTMNSSINYAAPLTIPATNVETSVNLTLKIDGQKIKALIKNGAVSGLEEYLTQEGGL